MEALLVGADRLGNIPQVLAGFGIFVGSHISGRDRAHQKKVPNLPRGTQLVILFTDFLGHNVMQSFRSAAKQEGVPLVCCRRSACSLRQALSSNIGRAEEPSAHCGRCSAAHD